LPQTVFAAVGALAYDVAMRLLVVALALAACTGHPGFERLDSCATCARGDVINGAIVRSNSIGWAARPNGGWVLLDGNNLAWADPLYKIAHEADVDTDGTLEVLAVGPDDTAYTAAWTTDDFDTWYEIAAVAPDGAVRWRLDRFIQDSGGIRMQATADAVYVYGVDENTISVGGATARGLFVVRLDPATGAVEWAWSTPNYADGDLEVAPRADGTVVVVGTVTNYSTVGAHQLDFAGLTAPLALGTNPTTGFVGSVDAGGDGQWVRTFTGPDRTRAYQVGVMDDGGIAIAGAFSNTSGTALDLGNGVVIPAGTGLFDDQFLGVLEPGGTTRWAMPLGHGISEQFSSLATRGDSIAVAGWYSEGPLSFGDAVMPVKQDAFIASVTNGALDWVTEAHGPEYEGATVVGRAGALDAVVRDANSTDPGPRGFAVGRVHVGGAYVLFANLMP
jgi:hypothetical protein